MGTQKLVEIHQLNSVTSYGEVKHLLPCHGDPKVGGNPRRKQMEAILQPPHGPGSWWFMPWRGIQGIHLPYLWWKRQARFPHEAGSPHHWTCASPSQQGTLLLQEPQSR